MSAPLVLTTVTGIDSVTNAMPLAATQPLASAPTPTANPPVTLNPLNPNCILQNGDKDVQYLVAPQTHTQCNPNMPV